MCLPPRSITRSRAGKGLQGYRRAAPAPSAAKPLLDSRAMHAPEQSLQEGEALVAAHAHGTPEFARGLALLQQAAAAGSVEAELTLGHVHAQVHLLPDADKQAAAW